MKKPKIRLGILGIVLGLMLMIPCGALAAPFTVTSIGHGSGDQANVYIGGQNRDGVYTEYSLNTTIGVLDAFCVENVATSPNPETYQFQSVPDDLYDAAWVAEKYWSAPGVAYDGGFFTREDTQIVVWELSIDTVWNLGTGDFRYNSGASATNIAAIYKYLTDNPVPGNYTAGNLLVVHHPAVNETTNYQDFMVRPIPEPASMLLMGAGLITWGVVHRRRRRERSKDKG